MNTTNIKGTLLEMRGKVKSKLGSLTGNRSLYLDGKKDELLGKGVQQYGKLKRVFAR